MLDCRRQWASGDRAVAQQRIERRLAAIFAADVAGYNRLMVAHAVIE
jgi:class 3 adenylate cyclase